MDTVWEFADLLYWYGVMLWRSYTATVISGTAMGIFLAQGSIFLALGIATYLLLRLLKRRPANKPVILLNLRRATRLAVLKVKGKRMSVKEREEFERILVEDIITTGLEELFLQGHMNKERRDWWYAYFAERVKLNGLVRSVRKGVKEKIKKRIQSDLYSNVVPFPDATTKPVVPNLKKRNIKKSA